MFNIFKKKDKRLSSNDTWQLLMEIPCDYNGYDIVFKTGKTDPIIYDKISKIISNNKYSLSELEFFKKMNINSSIDDFLGFYNTWIKDLQNKHFIAHLSSDTTIEIFANSIINILKNYNVNIKKEEIITNYEKFLESKKIDSKVNYGILLANIVEDLVRQYDLELINFFDGYSNEEFCVIPISKINEMERLEKLIK